MNSFAVLALAVVHIAWGGNSSHYEKPPCRADEQLSQISAKGYVCAPACPKGKCPSDVPKGVTAKAQCALKDPLGNKYCVLECTSDTECDQDGGATCDLVQPPKGVCVYKKKLDSNSLPQVTYGTEKKTATSAYKTVLQVTCPKSCSSCQCSGCKNITVPLGKCAAAGQGAGVIGSCNSAGTKFTETIYFNEKCQGQSVSRSEINTDACIQTSETKQYCAYFCKNEAAPEEVIV